MHLTKNAVINCVKASARAKRLKNRIWRGENTEEHFELKKII
jgi:hypothetical protein